MTSFTAVIELNLSPTTARAERLFEALSSWSPAVGRSSDGRLEATLTFEAASLWKAIAFAREHLDHLEDVAGLSVLETSIHDEREARAAESAAADAQLSVTQAAATLGVSRQRVLQLIEAGQLQATRVGRAWQVPESVVRARQAQAQGAVS